MTPADRGLQLPERESAPVVDDHAEDPAVVAGEKAREAAAAFSALAKTCRTSDDETSPEFVAADKRTTEADATFADAPVTSVAGALAKLAELRTLVSPPEHDPDETSLDTRYFKTVTAFLEGFAGEAQAEPLVELWAERDRVLALFGPTDTDLETDSRGDELSAIERRIATTEARTLAGVVVQIKLRESVLGHDHWVLSADLTRNVVTALERIAGAPRLAVVDDPAVVALAEYRVANAALEAFPDDEAEADTPEYEAAGARRYAARDAVYDAVPTSLAGVGAKVRFILDHEERGNDLWVPFDYMAKSMLPFLEGVAAAVPDPIVALWAEWGTINEEVMALSAAIPEGAGKNIGKTGSVPGKPWVALEEKDWDDALDRRDAVEQQIMEASATSMRGVAVKLRLATHRNEIGDLAPLYATPAREIDYEEVCGVFGWDAKHIISALRDAERLAGV